MPIRSVESHRHINTVSKWPRHPCGGECCPNTFICNKNIPGPEFCNLPNNPNFSAMVTAVSQLGFNAQTFKSAVTPMSMGSNTLYTASTAIMNGIAVSRSSVSQYKSFASGTGSAAIGATMGTGSGAPSSGASGTQGTSVSKAGAAVGPLATGNTVLYAGAMLGIESLVAI